MVVSRIVPVVSAMLLAGAAMAQANPPVTGNASPRGFISTSVKTQSSTKEKIAINQAGLDWIRLRYASLFNRDPFGWTPSQVERQFLRLFDAARISGGNGISLEDHKLGEIIRKAQIRANAIREVLTADIDGDNRVSRDELRKVLRHKFSALQLLHREARMQREFDKIFRNDRNRDGVITLDEISTGLAVRSMLGSGSTYQYGRKNEVPMTLDGNGDKIISRDEFLGAARTVFIEIDKDKDQLLSDREMSAFMLTMRDVRKRDSRLRRSYYAATRIARQIMRCRLPEIPKGAKLMFGATYRGQGLAAVRFAGKQQLLTVMQVHIEQGSEPLALILSAPQNLIWQITGAREWVVKVMAGSSFNLGQKTSVAVSGVAAGKVHFIETPNCLPNSFGSDIEREQISSALKTLTRVEPVSIVSASLGRKISFPSGKLDNKADNPRAIALPKDSPGAVFWHAVQRSFPAGVVRLDAKTIVSQLPLASDGVLPGRAGLAQLLDQGALEIPATQATGPGRRMTLPIEQLRIVAPLQFPAAISRGIVRKFVLAKNVRAPEGLNAGLCVVREDDGKPLSGSGRC